MRRHQWLIGSLAIVAGIMLWGGVLYAQSGYDLTWFSVDGSGGLSSGGAYSLRGIAGQANASQLSGGSYTPTGVLASKIARLPALSRNPKSSCPCLIIKPSPNALAGMIRL
jgi:hypothetical protein